MEIVERSEVGRVRSSNEDTCASDATQRCAVLADGMGGLAAGEIASRAAADVVLARIRSAPQRDEALLHEAIRAANREVLALTAQRASGEMGTTVVIWMDAGFGQCFVAHVGDSRAYRLRDGLLELLTSDHSLVQQMIDEGVISESAARVAPNRNIITRAIGLDATVQGDVRSCVYSQRDVFMLCSDGLTDLLTDREIQVRLLAHLDAQGCGSLDEAADSLVEEANNAGGTDNVSVVLIRPD